MPDLEKAPLPEEDSALRLETGSYILRSLIKDVVLSGDGAQDVKITCVEVWSMSESSLLRYQGHHSQSQY